MLNSGIRADAQIYKANISRPGSRVFDSEEFNNENGGASNRNSGQDNAANMQDSWERENLLTGSQAEVISSSSNVLGGVTNY